METSTLEMQKPLLLNLGCGSNKIDGAVNIDVNSSFEPDMVLNFIHARLPYESESVDKVYFFHTIEHIQEEYHVSLLREIWRVLKVGAYVYISYPEFSIVAKNYIENYRGDRNFWKATIFGRQASPADFHVSLMDTPFFKLLLSDLGFAAESKPESKLEPFNTIVRAQKLSSKPLTYEEHVKKNEFDNVCYRISGPGKE